MIEISRLLRGAGLGVAALFLAAAAPEPEPPLNPGLGDAVDACTPELASLQGSTPCLALGDGQRWVLLKDLRGTSQFLVIARGATLRLGHYDQPEPALFSAAWAARVCVRDILKELDQRDVPLDHIGVAINSRYGASQDRQHIHVNEVRDDILAAFAADAAPVAGPDAGKIRLGGSVYAVTYAPAIDDRAIFAAMAEAPPDLPTRRTVAVLADPTGGVLILTGIAGEDNRGSAEHDVLVATRRLDPADFVRRDHCPAFAG